MPRSGWIKPDTLERLSDHVSLGVLTRAFPPDVVDRVIAGTGAGQMRNRLLPSRLMVYYVMAMGLFAAGSYEEVMRSLLAGMEWVTGRFRDWQMPTKAAIFKARTRLGATVMAELFAEVAKPLAAPGSSGFYKSWRLVSVDGTSLDIADTPANEKYYGRPGTATQIKSAYPQARVLGLVECGTHAVIGAVVAGYDTAEQDMFPGLHADLDASMLLMADRGFFSYHAWRDSAGTGAALLWRMKASNVLPVLEELPDGSYRSAVYANPKARGTTRTQSPSGSSNTPSPPAPTPAISASSRPSWTLTQHRRRTWQTSTDGAGKSSPASTNSKPTSAAPEPCCAPKPPTGSYRKSTATSASTTPCVPSLAKSHCCSRKTPYGFPLHAPSGQPGEPSPTARLFPPEKLRKAFTSFTGEILHDLLPPRRQRTNPRVVKRKMSGWLSI